VSLASGDLKSRLKFARRNAALTQLDLATHLGITPQSVSSWERGEATPETDKIREICAFLSVDIGWLLGLGTLHAPPIETSPPNTQADPNIGNAYLYIDEWFERRGVNDEKVANRIGVTRSAVFKWRKEQDRLSPEKMAQLAAALDIEPAELWRHLALDQASTPWWLDYHLKLRR